TSGRRYFCKVGKTVDFLAFNRPGLHRLIVLAVRKTADVALNIKKFLETNSNRRYCSGMSVEDIYEEIGTGKFRCLYRSCDLEVVAATVREFTIPAELFAKKPKGVLGEAIWGWVNRWHEAPPRDQCAFRARCIWAFTVQPPLFLIGHFLKICVSIILTVFLLGRRAAVFFCGFRPGSFFSEIKYLWDHDPGSMVEYSPDVFYYPSNDWDRKYRYWGRNKNGEKVFMPVTPVEVVGACLSWQILVALWPFLTKAIPDIRAVFLALFMVLTLIFLTSVFFVRFIAPPLDKFVLRPIGQWWTKWRAKRLTDKLHAYAATKPPTPEKVLAKVPKPPKQSAYSRWLNGNLVVSKAPESVDLAHLPKPYGGRLPQVFRVGFWVAKMKVCRPYSK
ncbi:MAG: hypothetical protein PHF79_00595, partial [Candidatus Pacebacteria bacterium]|nr:hypothetical protein [Candidatus Paceibacterota bacterium]